MYIYIYTHTHTRSWCADDADTHFTTQTLLHTLYYTRFTAGTSADAAGVREAADTRFTTHALLHMLYYTRFTARTSGRRRSKRSC